MKKTLVLLLMLTICGLVSAQVPDQSWWTFSYPQHPSSDKSLLDLRYLNETFAGQNGFIKLSADGNSFATGKGKEIRFWACNGGSLAKDFNPAKLDTFARFLAKIGVNMIRYHGAINPRGKNTNINDTDTAEVNSIWRCVAAMKKQGIYTVISPFWPHNGHMGGWIPEEWGIEGYSGNDDLWAVLYFNEKLKQGYKSWVKYLYSTPNPYTGIALKDEPAVAIIQVENEDAVFFWTMGSIKPALAKMVGQQFAEWTIAKYGTLDGAAKSWGPGTGHKDDDFKNGVLGLSPIYELTVPQNGALSKRIQDQTEFYARKEKAFYDEMVSYYRNELGCKQLTNGNNWRTASQSRLLDLERWSNSGAEVMAVNKYFDPQHKGPNDGWRIDPGDFYAAPSALKNPADLPSNIKHLEGHPMMVTESAWNLPNKYQTEGSLLIAAYGGLSGLDAFFWFSPTASTFTDKPYFEFLNIKGQHPMNRWSTSTPGEMGMFPANALIHRMGYVKEAMAVKEERSLKSLFERTVPQIFEEQSFDPNRDFVVADPKNEDNRTLSPLTFLTGGVVTSYESKTDTTRVLADLAKLINSKDRTVSSVTGQQHLDYKNGIFALNTPKAKALSGFLSTQKKVDLGGVRITSGNEYATIELVSMDGRDLLQSGKILLQIGTIFRPTGWKEEASTLESGNVKKQGFRITNTGKMPWLGMPAIGSISFPNKRIKKAIQLDAAGYEVKTLSLSLFNNQVSLDFPADSYYILLTE